MPLSLRLLTEEKIFPLSMVFFHIFLGDITVDEATEIFENMRMSLIESKERQKEKQLDDSNKQEKGL